MQLSSTQQALLRDCARWGEIGPDAEIVSGCHGAAFNRVVDALIRKGALTEGGLITPDGRSLLNQKQDIIV